MVKCAYILFVSEMKASEKEAFFAFRRPASGKKQNIVLVRCTFVRKGSILERKSGLLGKWRGNQRKTGCVAEEARFAGRHQGSKTHSASTVLVPTVEHGIFDKRECGYRA